MEKFQVSRGSEKNFRFGVVGRWYRREFLPIVKAISAVKAVSAEFETQRYADLSLIDQEFDLVFLFQSYPGEFTREQLSKIRHNFPLCRFVLIAGVFCQGENRTGIVPDGVFRYYVSQWTEMKREIDLFLSQKSSLLSQPMTISEEEMILSSSWEGLDVLEMLVSWKKRVYFHSDDSGLCDYLEDLCQIKRLQRVSLEQHPDFVIFDLPEQSLDQTKTLVKKLRHSCRDGRLLLLNGTFCADDVTALLTLGADFVLSKPFL